METEDHQSQQSQTYQPTTVVTGITGFIGGHLVDQLLYLGHKVIGTLRSKTKAALLINKFSEAISSGQLVLETVSDVRNEHEFQKLFETYPDVRYVIHAASPLPCETTDPLKDILEPAIQGTLAVMKSAQKFPNIEKIVVTSSLAAISNMHTWQDPRITLTEESWNPITWEEACGPHPMVNYVGSKTFAEKAAWKFMRDEKPAFALTVVNPPFVFGPEIIPTTSEMNISNLHLVNSALDTKKGIDPTPDYPSCYFVDVRDCAKAHISALDRKLDDCRLFLTTDKFCTQDLLDVANTIPELHGKIAVGKAGNRELELAKCCTMDNSKTKKLLNYQWIGLDKSVKDFAEQWLLRTSDGV